jgi:hypothetical protein
MTQLLSWVAFPVALALASLGCGLLVQKLTGRELPEPLLLPVGLALVVVVAELTTKLSATARFTTPVVVALALIGVAWARPWRPGGRPRLGGWPLAAAVGVYVVYLAPVFLTGEPTFTGYIKLDDTAAWMAMTDRVMSHGHDLAGLPPSTYERTLHLYLTGGEPVGSMLPWGIGHQLVGQNLAWVFQPYLALLAAMLALSAWPLIAPLVRSRPLRGAAVFLAAQSALLYGYAAWGGIKELAAAWLLPLIVACTLSVFEGGARVRSFDPFPVFEARAPVRSFVPLAVASFAMLGVLGFGGAVFLALPLLVVFVWSVLVWRQERPCAQLAALIAAGVALGAGLVWGAHSFKPLTTTTIGLGNLVARLNPLQLLGIWPAADFRISPPNVRGLAYALIAIVALGACAGLAVAWRKRSWPAPLYLATAALGAVAVSSGSTPWIQGKAFAIVSPAALLLALGAAAALASSARKPWRYGAALAGAAICVGVLWSNVLAYRHVTVAPYDQLAELKVIGGRFAGQGPTLVNQYQPYATQHFLIGMDPESPSERRRRLIPLQNGQSLANDAYADLDAFGVPGILVYRTVVIPASPVSSRPPSPYRLVYTGRWYQVWQRPIRGYRPVLAHLGLGDQRDPTAVPPCTAVLSLASTAGPHGLLAAATRPSPSVVAVPSPLPEGTTSTSIEVSSPGSYELWLGGSFWRLLTTYVNGVRVSSIRGHLGEPGDYTPLGTVRLGAGPARISLAYGDAALDPGGAGPGAGPVLPVGPLALSPLQPAPSLTYVPPANARSLCGKAWDWVESLGP